MDILQGTQYYVLRDGQKFGPVEGSELVQLAQSRRLFTSDHLWTEGMAQWAPANVFSVLAPVFALQNPADTQIMRPAAPPQSEVIEQKQDPSLAGGQTQETAGKSEIHTSNLPTRPHGFTGPVQILSSEPTGPGASFGLLVSLLIISIGSLIAAISFPIILAAQEGGSSLGGGGANEGAGKFIWILPVSIVAASLALLIYVILSLVYLYRAWDYLQGTPNITTTPGKAVGLLFIPIYNIIWIFFAFYNWSRDYNMRCDMTGSPSAPRAAEGLFMAFCILSLIGLPFLLHVFVMRQMCRGINFLSTIPRYS